ncbi:PREDICTED: brachyurin-like [Rhagoletis zephyria]|uniref:brachyurin-like n=1 Tax=Rhagoletis zephyria TaxID=28612 RepID=UPI000811320A|nr:PREDICTED: brachyurin-like [Rhagoletis zephyria]
MRLKLLPFLYLMVILATVQGYVGPDIRLGQIQNRIISGTPASSGQFPWQVILKLDPQDDLLCGGSIISTIWVLTAAHCTYGQSSMFLMFGTVLFNNPNALNMTATQLYVHPNYNDATLNNDVSLIQLPTALTFSKTIQPIQLVPSSYANFNFIGQIAMIAGFGLTDDENLDFSNNLLYAQVEIINNNNCESVFGANVVISSTLCAQGENGTDMSICSGDSGGPLITTDRTGTWMQIGINSFVAEDMCTEGYPSGYARLTSFLGYISQVTGIAFNST